MTSAAADIQSSNEKIVDIALKYGYELPTAFNYNAGSRKENKTLISV